MLLELTEFKIAYISVVRTHVHLISIQGGPAKKMKGFHTLLKSNLQKVTDSTCLINALLDTDNIYDVLSGPFTKKQKEAAKKQTKIHLHKVVPAWKWLHQHNKGYGNTTMDEMGSLPYPEIEIISDRNGRS